MLKNIFTIKTKPLDPQKIEKLYMRWMYISMILTLGCFSFAIEQTAIIFPLMIIVTFAYILKRPILQKFGDLIGFLVLLFIFIAIFIITKGDTLFAAGAMLMGTYIIFFFRDAKYQKSLTNLLMILGLMLLSTSLLNRFEYILFFLPFVYASLRLLHYSLLHRHNNIASPVQVIRKKTLNYRNNLQRWTAKIGIIVISCLIAIIIFILIPRSHKWEFATSDKFNIGKTGFSDKIASASVQSILSDPNIFFVVQTKNTSDYFKGTVYDTFNGTDWRSTLASKKVRFTGHIKINKRPSSFSTEVYKFRNATTKTIFYRGEVCSIRASNAYMFLEIDKSGNMVASRKLKKIVYLLEYAQKTSKTTWDTTWIKNTFLQLPKISTRVKNLAKKITLNKKTTKLKAHAIQEYLKKTYPYTLNMYPRDNEVSDYFLFEAKKGYCIHFATAMTVMLRSLQIPARVVGGFRSGKYQKGHCIVSNEDAHAWVEVFQKNKGWTFFDPTPPQEDYLIGLSYWKKLYYKLYAFWTLEIAGFSRSQQKIVYAFIKKTLLWLKSQIWIFVIFTLLFYVRRYFPNKKTLLLNNKKRNSKNKLFNKKERINIANSFYQRMLNVLEKKSLFKFTKETPFEFEKRSKKEFPKAVTQIKNITRIFCEIQFGHREFTKEKEKSIEDNIKKLEKIILDE